MRPYNDNLPVTLRESLSEIMTKICVRIDEILSDITVYFLEFVYGFSGIISSLFSPFQLTRKVYFQNDSPFRNV